MILGQDPKEEQFKLIGYTLYKYIWNKKSIHDAEQVIIVLDQLHSKILHLL